jgi:hypothetical protein
MRVIAPAFAIIALAATAVLASEVIQVPLPELAGYYSQALYSRSAPFHLGRAPLAVTSVSIRLIGSTDLGEYYCDLGYGEQGPFPYPEWFTATIPDTINQGLWWADGYVLDQPVGGEFENTAPFRRLSGPATWGFLTSGYGTVRLDGMPPALILMCYSTLDPDGTITSATLLIEGEFPVAAERSTWGGIKALYR